MTENNKNNDVSSIAKALSIFFQLGITIVVTIVLCLFFGKFLDTKFQTGNIWTLIFLFLGILAAIRNMYYILKNVMKK